MADFTFAMWQTLISCLLCEFISPKVLVINLFEHLRIFLVELGNSSEFLGLSKWDSKKKFSICWGKQELARTCRGKTLSALKLAMDSVNFGLCNYPDYFACRLLIAKNIYILTFKEESCLSIVLLIAWYSFPFLSFMGISQASFQIKNIT